MVYCGGSQHSRSLKYGGLVVLPDLDQAAIEALARKKIAELAPGQGEACVCNAHKQEVNAFLKKQEKLRTQAAVLAPGAAEQEIQPAPDPAVVHAYSSSSDSSARSEMPSICDVDSSYCDDRLIVPDEDIALATQHAPSALLYVPGGAHGFAAQVRVLSTRSYAA